MAGVVGMAAGRSAGVGGGASVGPSYGAVAIVGIGSTKLLGKISAGAKGGVDPGTPETGCSDVLFNTALEMCNLIHNTTRLHRTRAFCCGDGC